MTLAKDTAETVARHLVMAGRLVDDDPRAALAHARAARALAGRVAAAREANGLVAYAAGEWAEALTELRTARRISGDPSHLPVMADCERALGRPDRALLVVEDPQADGLDAAARVELLIVASGARRDLGQAAAAVVSLQVGALEGQVRPWTARLRYAYADALLESGRPDDARDWFARTAEIDPEGETDAVDRLLELDGVVLDDPLEDDEEPDGRGLDAARTTVTASFEDAMSRDAARTQAEAPPEVAEVMQAPPEVAAVSPVVPEVAGAPGVGAVPGDVASASSMRAPAVDAPTFSDAAELRLFE